MPHLPAHPDIQRQLKDRLLSLSPRAFEYFAGDLLTYIGLQNVTVTRYIGDGGIDAQGDLIANSGFVSVRTGVQVKRLRQNVQRPDIDRFIGALGGQFQHGIFITTAGYAEQAKVKARSSPLLRVDTIDGAQVVALMGRHQIGTQPTDTSPQIDEDFFLAFEAQASNQPTRLADSQVAYQTAPATEGSTPALPQDDLISIRALGYELRVDTYTVQDWVRSGKLQPDSVTKVGQRESYFFRRDNIGSIRSQFGLSKIPASNVEWRQSFLDYARSKSRLTKSYKPVLLKTLLRLVDRHGEVHIDELTREFHAFYLQRQRDNLITEIDGDLKDPSLIRPETVQKLIIKYPLDRFLLQHFLEYDRQAGIVRFAPQLWQELRFYELIDVQSSADEQLRYYYDRLGHA